MRGEMTFIPSSVLTRVLIIQKGCFVQICLKLIINTQSPKSSAYLKFISYHIRSSILLRDISTWTILRRQLIPLTFSSG
ncbi:hypothetical protein HanRHA438_Chr01g0015971 [Helianthus annuus]|nr:hypothetical protein HanRHA438_Chr01g0015971 [Helianthus annuus]